MTLVELERRGVVALITLNRPEVRNAIDGPTARALGTALDEVEADTTVRAAVLAAAITEPRPVFCAGDDLRALGNGLGGQDPPTTPGGGFAGIVRYPRTKPIVAAIDGLATSGGLEIVLACDLVLATRRSSFALAEVKWNLVAGAGGLFRLPWAIGRTAAMDMILTGDPISAERGHQLGLVSALVDGDVVAAAIDKAERIAANGPRAVAASRRVCETAFSTSEAELWKATDDAIADILKSKDLKIGLAAFADRTPPEYTGR